jgi:hypothetical protein
MTAIVGSWAKKGLTSLGDRSHATARAHRAAHRARTRLGAGNLGTYEDRIAIEDVMARYVWTVDSLDADVSTSRCSPRTPSSTRTGTSVEDAEIRKIVTNLIQRRGQQGESADG